MAILDYFNDKSLMDLPEAIGSVASTGNKFLQDAATPPTVEQVQETVKQAPQAALSAAQTVSKAMQPAKHVDGQKLSDYELQLVEQLKARIPEGKKQDPQYLGEVANIIRQRRIKESEAKSSFLTQRGVKQRTTVAQKQEEFEQSKFGQRSLLGKAAVLGIGSPQAQQSLSLRKELGQIRMRKQEPVFDAISRYYDVERIDTDRLVSQSRQALVTAENAYREYVEEFGYDKSDNQLRELEKDIAMLAQEAQKPDGYFERVTQKAAQFGSAAANILPPLVGTEKPSNEPWTLGGSIREGFGSMTGVAARPAKAVISASDLALEASGVNSLVRAAGIDEAAIDAVNALPDETKKNIVKTAQTIEKYLPQESKDLGVVALAALELFGIKGASKALQQATPDIKKSVSDLSQAAKESIDNIKMPKVLTDKPKDQIKTFKKGETPEMQTKSGAILETMHKTNPSARNKFASKHGIQPADWLVQRGLTQSTEKLLPVLFSRWQKSFKEADKGFAAIKGTYKDVSIERALAVLGEEIAEQTSKAKGAKPQWSAQYKNLARKYEREGLTMTQINSLKRLYAKNVKTAYINDATKNSADVAAKTTVESGLRKWQAEKAKELGFDDLAKINKETQQTKEILDAVGYRYTSQLTNKQVGLTDAIIAAQIPVDPNAAIFFAGKKLGESGWFNSLRAKWLSRNIEKIGQPELQSLDRIVRRATILEEQVKQAKNAAEKAAAQKEFDAYIKKVTDPRTPLLLEAGDDLPYEGSRVINVEPIELPETQQRQGALFKQAGEPVSIQQQTKVKSEASQVKDTPKASTIDDAFQEANDMIEARRDAEFEDFLKSDLTREARKAIEKTKPFIQKSLPFNASPIEIPSDVLKDAVKKYNDLLSRKDEIMRIANSASTQKARTAILDENFNELSSIERKMSSLFSSAQVKKIEKYKSQMKEIAEHKKEFASLKSEIEDALGSRTKEAKETAGKTLEMTNVEFWSDMLKMAYDDNMITAKQFDDYVNILEDFVKTEQMIERSKLSFTSQYEGQIKKAAKEAREQAAQIARQSEKNRQVTK